MTTNLARGEDIPLQEYFLNHEKDDVAPKAKTLTLADIKKRARREAEEARNDNHIKRFQMLNFTSDEYSAIDEPNLISFYCFICGTHCFIIEGDITKLVMWKGQHIISIKDIFHKLYMRLGEEIWIKESDRVEMRVLYRCRQCDFLLGYRVKQDEQTDCLTDYVYILQDAVIKDQTKTVAFQAALKHSTPLPAFKGVPGC